MKCKFILETPNGEYVLLRDYSPQVGDIINTYRITECHLGIGNRSRREYYGCVMVCKGEEIK